MTGILPYPRLREHERRLYERCTEEIVLSCWPGGESVARERLTRVDSARCSTSCQYASLTPDNDRTLFCLLKKIQGRNAQDRLAVIAKFKRVAHNNRMLPYATFDLFYSEREEIDTLRFQFALGCAEERARKLARSCLYNCVWRASMLEFDNLCDFLYVSTNTYIDRYIYIYIVTNTIRDWMPTVIVYGCSKPYTLSVSQDSYYAPPGSSLITKALALPIRFDRSYRLWVDSTYGKAVFA